ncbi:calcium-binding protein [Puniceibacterium sp. IMCC21224]|uniref:calcium-binding protein n=1 Tax=Puniceibacterium sp. IMCC21224 TaxID=1618204 RepID=UPI00064DC7EB|nr:calcium-binding protein [Puniceibacterium sp. IMCC21224]KMK63980.1 putative calcium-binding protein [Puniceibacterium sp. IMCC21224]
MNITYFGTNSDFLSDGFFQPGDGDLDVISASSTEIVVRNPDTGVLTTLTGTGFALQNGEPAGGTITSMTIREGTNTLATFSNIAWSLVAFEQAAVAATEDDNFAPLGALMSSSGNIIIDASGATDPFEMDDFEYFSQFLTTSVILTGTGGDDELIGGNNADTINPGANDGYDRIHGTQGNDTIVFGGADSNSYYEIEYDRVAGPLTVTADTGAGSVSVVGAGFTDTYQNAAAALTAPDGGLGIVGSRGNDAFNITTALGTWITIGGGAGRDVYNLTLNESMRLFFNWDGVNGANQGLVMNLATGVVSNDGLGFTDQINVSGPARLEIRATDFADRLTGSDRDESFITERGNDTVDGGGGFDRVRYDRSGVDAVTVDLVAGTATGTWDGFGFTDTLTSIEYIRGSRYGNDVILGTGADERFEGEGGNDSLVGRGGDDRLEGDSGNDTLIGGDGRDRLDGGDGNDLLDASGGDAATQGYGDYIRPGLGSDTILGHAALYANDAGLDISYGPLSGIGGLTIVVGANGTGTAVSGTAGAVNDTFTYANYFEGSGDGDLITGSDADHYEGYAPLGGADTVHGGGGFDELNYSYEAEYYGGNGSGITANMGAGTVIDTQGFTDRFSGIDQIRGSAFADSMAAGGVAGGVRFYGEAGNDTIVGGAGDDYLNDGAGNDSLTGGAGNDFFVNEGGTDVFDGGAGVDTLFTDVTGTAADAYTLVANLTTGEQYGLEFADQNVDTLVSIENYQLVGLVSALVTGNADNNRLTTDAGDDTITGGLGNDTVDAGFGTDTAVLAVNRTDATATEQTDGSIRIVSSQGTDIFVAVEFFEFNDGTVAAADLFEEEEESNDAPGELVPGTDGDDTLTGTANNDTVAGGAGNDTLNGAGGNDNISASDGDDVVDGGAGNDSIGGGTGNDTILGGSGNDVIGAGQGDDDADGGTGNDVVNGGPGNDTLIGGEGDDTMGASFGNDRVEGRGGDDSLGGGTGRDTLLGEGGDDAIGAGEGNDSVDGGAGNDFLAGGGRNDVVLGGTGNDTINGGAGNDTLDGGTGSDVFVFNDFVSGEVDRILNFEDGSDSFRMTGIMNAPGTGLQGRVDALNITDVTIEGEAGVSMTYAGHEILLTGVSAAALGVEDFTFL